MRVQANLQLQMLIRDIIVIMIEQKVDWGGGQMKRHPNKDVYYSLGAIYGRMLATNISYSHT